MKKQLTEQQVLDLLDIPDFRHLSKDKVMKFTSSLPDMEPSVAISALQQFPKFAETSIEILYLIFDYPHKHYTFKYFEV